MSDNKVYISPNNGRIDSKSIQETETEIIIPVVGIPFGSPEEKDLHDEYFDKGTDVGPLREVMVYFNHNSFLPANDTPEELEKSLILARAFRGEILGMAYKDESTEEGVIYNIVLDKRKRYTRALREMIENNLLDVSSGSKYRENDTENKGRISKWHTVEISLTPSPANPNAAPLTKSILAEALEETNMPKQAKEQEVEQELGGAQETQPAPNPTDELMKSMQAILEKPQESEAEVKAQESNTELRILELQSQIQALTELVKSIQVALPYMAEQIVTRIDGVKSASTFERNVVTQISKPATPPVVGKSIFGQHNPNAPKMPYLKAIGES